MLDRPDETVTRFIVLISRRCGSTMLRQAIFQHHPEVVFLGEILNASLDVEPGPSRWPLQRTILDDLYDGRFERLPLVPPVELETIDGKSSIRAISCKTGMIIGDDDAFVELLDRRAVRVIVITRRNLLELAISHLNGMRWSERTGGRWNVRPGEQIPRKLEVDAILEFIDAPPAPVTPAFTKMTPDDRRDIVANVGDLEAYVAERDWEEWLQ